MKNGRPRKAVNVKKPRVREILLAAALLFFLLLESAPLQAERLLIVGDSWASQRIRTLYDVIQENEHSDVIVQRTPRFGLASELGSPAGFPEISRWFETWPDTSMVHLSIGGNDLINALPNSVTVQEMAATIASIVTDVEAIVDHMLTVQPGVKILLSSYDFFRPIGSRIPAEVNAVFLELTDKYAEMAATRVPGLYFSDLNGLLQVTYGFDGVQHSQYDPAYPIPPGDPSLPDPELPSPIEAFQPRDYSHLTYEGYKVLAQAQYDEFYGPLLNEQKFQINAGLNDAWFNPVTDGQGFFINVFPDSGQLFLGWFTYELERPDESVTAQLGEPGHRWLTAQGPYADNQAVLDVHLTAGGVFDTSPPVPENTPDGEIIVEFESCNSGTVSYDIPSVDRQGVIPIQRITLDNVPLCESLLPEIRR